jgi:hypothetical protein
MDSVESVQNASGIIAVIVERLKKDGVVQNFFAFPNYLF